jgi:hypothetical protein
MRKSAPTTARKETAFKRKTPPKPITLTSRPAMAGPTSAAPWNVTEFSEMAFIKSR